LFEDTTEEAGPTARGRDARPRDASGSKAIPNLAPARRILEPLLLLCRRVIGWAAEKHQWSELAEEKFLLLHEEHSVSIIVRQLLAATKSETRAGLCEARSGSR